MPINYLLIKNEVETTIDSSVGIAKTMAKIHDKKVMLSDAIIVVTGAECYFGLDTLREIEFAFEKARINLMKTLGEEDKIIYEKCLKITENDSTILVDIFFKVKENISETQMIDIDSLKNNEKKMNRR